MEGTQKWEHWCWINLPDSTLQTSHTASWCLAEIPISSPQSHTQYTVHHVGSMEPSGASTKAVDDRPTADTPIILYNFLLFSVPWCTLFFPYSG